MKRLPLMDLAQFVAALLVILIHCGRLVENEVLHFVLKSLLARIAVPLFLVINGYFYREKQKKDSSYPKRYFWRQLQVYFLWSLFYLPYGWQILQEQKISFFWYPAAFIVALLYLGSCYHLWYFPTLLMGIKCSSWLTKRYSYPVLFCLAGSFFFLGSSETYSAYLTGIPAFLYENYQKIFFTTRNGVFFGFIFVLMGFFLSDYPQHSLFTRKPVFKLGASLILFAIEGSIVFHQQGTDKNFFFALIPISLLLVSLLRKDCSLKHTRRWKEYSKGLFFLHPFFLEIIQKTAAIADFRISGLQLFCLTALMTLLFLIGKKQGEKVLKGFFFAEKDSSKSQKVPFRRV